MLILGDVRSQPDKLEKFIKYKPKTNHLILGNIINSFAKREDIIKCFELVLESQILVLYGGNDISYRLYPPYDIKDFRVDISSTIRNIINRCEDRWQCAWGDDTYIATSAGIHPRIATFKSPREQAKLLNFVLKESIERHNHTDEIFNKKRENGDPFPGPMWLNYITDNLSNKWSQIFGHIPTGIDIITNDIKDKPHICLDMKDDDQWICFNTQTHMFEDLKTGNIIDIIGVCNEENKICSNKNPETFKKYCQSDLA